MKALIDDHGDQVKEAPPSMPVQVLGLLRAARGRRRVPGRPRTRRRPGPSARPGSSASGSPGHRRSPTAPGAQLEDLFEQIQRGETATLNLVLKADVQGSLEAITESLRKLERDDVKLSFVHRGVGGITENDVQLAVASNATIIGFNVRPDRRARGAGRVERRRDPDLRDHLQAPRGHRGGHAGHARPRVRRGRHRRGRGPRGVPHPPGRGRGRCYVRDGVITRGSKVRFLREGVVIWKGAINSLRRFKDDVREVQSGFECGIGLSDFQDLKEGDIIETFEEREIPTRPRRRWRPCSGRRDGTESPVAGRAE